MAACHHEATAAHQTAAVALSRFAEVSLGVDRFVALAERILADTKVVHNSSYPRRHRTVTVALREEARPMAETNNTQDLLATLRDAR